MDDDERRRAMDTLLPDSDDERRSAMETPPDSDDVECPISTRI